MSNLDKVESSLDQLQDRGRIVDRMVNEALLGKGRDDHRWHAHARTPLIDDRWRHVIPIAAVLVEGDDAAFEFEGWVSAPPDPDWESKPPAEQSPRAHQRPRLSPSPRPSPSRSRQSPFGPSNANLGYADTTSVGAP